MENIVNSRPLTPVSLDATDEVPLTPNHFLLGGNFYLFLSNNFEKDDTFSRKQWRKVGQMADHFWRRWVKEYLPT